MDPTSVEEQHAIRSADAIKEYLKRRLNTVCRVLQIEVEEERSITILVRLLGPRRPRHPKCFDEIMLSSMKSIFGNYKWDINHVVFESSQKHSKRRTLPLTSS
jgi:hypothetical protein